MDFDEIYNSRTEEYNALVRREDAAGRLWNALDQLVDWAGVDVCELGAGTGRLTIELAARSPNVYAFADRAEAERLVAGFFGEQMLTNLIGPERASLAEVTGIWIAQRTPG